MKRFALCLSLLALTAGLSKAAPGDTEKPGISASQRIDQLIEKNLAA